MTGSEFRALATSSRSRCWSRGWLGRSLPTARNVRGLYEAEARAGPAWDYGRSPPIGYAHPEMKASWQFNWWKAGDQCRPGGAAFIDFGSKGSFPP
jgi:hypothetical protein